MMTGAPETVFHDPQRVVCRAERKVPKSMPEMARTTASRESRGEMEKHPRLAEIKGQGPDLKNASALIEQSVVEETATDKLMTKLATSSMNPMASKAA